MDSSSEHGPTIQPDDEILKAVVGASYALLAVDSNEKPGTKLYNGGVRNVKRLLGALRDTALRKRSQLVMRTMDEHFKSHINHTWRRFVLLLLEMLGVPTQEIEAVMNRRKIKPEYLLLARTALETRETGRGQLTFSATGPQKRFAPKEVNVQGPTSSREEPCKKRFKDKNINPQTGSSAADSTQRHCSNTHASAQDCDAGDAFGHYAALGISTGASASEIRSGYYRCALATHPDKPGGSEELFRPVRRAFDILGDSEKRAEYEKIPCTQAEGGSGRDITSGSESSKDKDTATKVACASMMAAPAGSWPSRLATLSKEALGNILKMLKAAEGTDGSKSGGDVMACIGADSDADAKPTPNESSVTGTKGITRRSQAGYTITVSWRNLFVKTGAPIPTLEQAVRIHIILMQLRDVAALRYRKFRKEARRFGCVDPVGGDDDCPPLLPEEIFEAFCEEPTLPLRFSSDLNRPQSSKDTQLRTRENRVQSPFTPSLASALIFRSWIRRVLAQKYKAVAGADHIDVIKKMMEHQTAADCQARRSLEINLIEAVSAEVDCRSQQTASQPLAIVAPSEPLKLLDKDMVEQVMTLAQAALESQKEQNEQLREQAQRASHAEEAFRFEVVQFKDEMANVQTKVAVQEAELKLAWDAKHQAERRASSMFKSVAATAEAQALKDATQQKEELEQELLKMQKKLNQSERERDTALRTAAAESPGKRVLFAPSRPLEVNRTQRLVEESIRAANRDPKRGALSAALLAVRGF